MAETTQAGNGTPGATDPQPQGQVPATSSTPQAGSENTPTTTPTTGEFSGEEAKRIIAELRKENAQHRTELKKFQDAQKAAEDAQLSEQEKLTKALAEHQANAAELALRNQQLRLQLAVRDHAAALNLSDPALALVALQTEHAHELDADEDGNYTNVDKLLAQVVKDHPALAAQPQRPPTQPPASSGGAASPSRSQTAAQPQTMRDLRTQPPRTLNDIEWSR